MGAPKSVVKIKKDGVEYTSDVDKCEYYIFELCRAALRDSAKFVVKRFRESFYSTFKKHTGNAGRSTKYNVYSGKNTKYPRVDIGLRSGNSNTGFYAYFQEVGTSKTKRLGLLSKTVEENVDELQKIQAQYLSAMDDELKAKALIDESEIEGGEDD